LGFFQQWHKVILDARPHGQSNTSAVPLAEIGGEAGGVRHARVKWNFTKFLIDRQGRVVRRYGPARRPGGLARDIEAVLR
jgi:glutathione peroxidase-family protein